MDKSESRNPKFETNPKFEEEISRTARQDQRLESSCFEFRICFGFRQFRICAFDSWLVEFVFLAEDFADLLNKLFGAVRFGEEAAHLREITGGELLRRVTAGEQDADI